MTSVIEYPSQYVLWRLGSSQVTLSFGIRQQAGVRDSVRDGGVISHGTYWSYGKAISFLEGESQLDD